MLKFLRNTFTSEFLNFQTQNSEFETQNSEFETRNSEFAIFNSVFATQNSELGYLIVKPYQWVDERLVETDDSWNLHNILRSSAHLLFKWSFHCYYNYFYNFVLFSVDWLHCIGSEHLPRFV